MADRQLTMKKMEQLADEHPDLREAYTAKIAQSQKRSDNLAKENVIKVLDDLESTLDQVEEQLKKVDAGKIRDKYC